MDLSALTLSLPIDGSQWNSVFVAADKPVTVRAETPSAAFSPVGAGYFDTLGQRVVRGRVFDARDGDGAPQVVVVNESLARRIWPGEDAVGKQLKQGWSDSKTPWREVVGVVGDVKFEGLTVDTPMQVYVPIMQNQVRQIAEKKLPDLNAHDVDQAAKIIEGTARSMGVEVVA